MNSGINVGGSNPCLCIAKFEELRYGGDGVHIHLGWCRSLRPVGEVWRGRIVGEAAVDALS